MNHRRSHDDHGAEAALDVAHRRFLQLKPELDAMAADQQSEADTRALIIDKILEQVLGWRPGQIFREESQDRSRLDYRLNASAHHAIVEAKRAGIHFGLPATTHRWYKFTGASIQGSPNAREALEQASEYALRWGCELAVATNGSEWLIFRASRTDGIKPSDGWVAAFKSLDELTDPVNFGAFYSLFGEPVVRSGNFRALFRAQEGGAENIPKVVGERALDRALSQGQRRRRQSDLSKALAPLFDDLFSHIGSRNQKEILRECFVETRESAEADDRLQRITQSLVEDVGVIDERAGVGGELTAQVRSLVDSTRGKTVLILGQNGAGKTTFIDRFFNIALPKDLRKRVNFASIDLSAAPPDAAALPAYMRRQTMIAVERSVFGKDGPEYQQLKGSIFNREYLREKNGAGAVLFKADPEKFELDFADDVKRWQKDPERYLAGMFGFCRRSKKSLPVIVFDNADHFDETFQTTAFLQAQWTTGLGDILLILPIRDTTFWRSHQTGPFRATSTTVLYLPRPPLAKVLEKRFYFASKELAELSRGKSTQIPSLNGIRVTVTSANELFEALTKAFARDKHVGYAIAALSGGDMRESLRLFQRLVLSPHLGLDRYLAAYLSRGEYKFPQWDSERALMLGDWEHYARDHDRSIVNLFACPSRPDTSPLLALRVLLRAYELRSAGANQTDLGFAPVGAYLAYFEAMGVPREHTDEALGKLLFSGLLEPYSLASLGHDFGGAGTASVDRVRITSAGRLHRNWVLRSACYAINMSADATVVDMRLLDELVALYEDRFHALSRRDDRSRIKRLERAIFSRTIRHLLALDAETVSVPATPDYRSQSSLETWLNIPEE